MNKGPDMTARDDIDKIMKNTVQQDMLKTVGILKNDNNNNSFYLIYG
jgi:Holliday junction resolvase RusA-like endonuclease